MSNLRKAAPQLPAEQQNMPTKLPVPPAPIDALEVIYAEGWNAACDAFFGGMPAPKPIVITITTEQGAELSDEQILQRWPFMPWAGHAPESDLVVFARAVIAADRAARGGAA